MGELPDGNKSVGIGSRIGETELNEASWRKWVNKGKEQDARRRKQFYQMLWILLPAIILLALWSLAFRQ
jgi:hypothetical protein